MNITTFIFIITFILIAVCAILFIRWIVTKHPVGDNDSQADILRGYMEAVRESNRQTLEAMRHDTDARIRSIEDEGRRSTETLTRILDERLRQANERTCAAFDTIARNSLDDNTDRLKRDNATQMETVLSPLRQRIEELTRLIHDVEVNRNGAQQVLRERLDQLAEMNRTLGQEARGLALALRGNSKVQGDWGETILKTILDKAGLKEGLNYRSQPGSDAAGHSYRSDENTLLRPDFIIDLPDGHHVIIDSKVSLTDYVRYCEATDESGRSAAARRHLESVKRHINELATKKYQKAVEGSLEHVLMFIPNEGAYLAAMTIDDDLWRYAYDRNVAIVSPAHVLSTVQVIGQLWRQDRQDRNAAEIARVAGLLHDSLLDFATRFDKVGAALDSTRRTYDETRNMLSEENPKSLTRRAARLRELGAKTHR